MEMINSVITLIVCLGALGLSIYNFLKFKDFVHAQEIQRLTLDTTLNARIEKIELSAAELEIAKIVEKNQAEEMRKREQHLEELF